MPRKKPVRRGSKGKTVANGFPLSIRFHESDLETVRDAALTDGEVTTVWVREVALQRALALVKGERVPLLEFQPRAKMGSASASGEASISLRLRREDAEQFRLAAYREGQHVMSAWLRAVAIQRARQVVVAREPAA
jgi:uncharacterized protein (DUF1778 family)